MPGPVSEAALDPAGLGTQRRLGQSPTSSPLARNVGFDVRLELEPPAYVELGQAFLAFSEPVSSSVKWG